MNEEKISLVGLRQCLRGYDQGMRNEHCAYRYRDWKIGDGAYDENWRLSYKGNECVRAFSSGSFLNSEEIDNLSFPIEDFVRVYDLIVKEYGNNEKLYLDLVYNHPEISQMVDLSQALTKEDQCKWESKYQISIADDLVVQKIAKELIKRIGISLERNPENPTVYDLGVPYGGHIGDIWYELHTDGTLPSLEKALCDTYRSFNTSSFDMEYISQGISIDPLATIAFKHKLDDSYKLARKIIREKTKQVSR